MQMAGQTDVQTEEAKSRILWFCKHAWKLLTIFPGP